MRVNTVKILACIATLSIHFFILSPLKSFDVHELQNNSNIPTQPVTTPLCNREQIRSGSWESTVLPHGAPYIPIDNWQKSCHRRERRDFNLPWNTYQWIPHDERDGKCVFSKWNATTFCDMIVHNTNNSSSIDNTATKEEVPITISFIGDSTTFQHYSSLAMLLGQTVTEREQHASRKNHQSVTKSTCHGAVTLSYLRDDTLDMMNQELILQKPNIVILNTGLHYRRDDILLRSMNRTITFLEKWQNNCRKSSFGSRRLPWCLPILRTTMPGHPHCDTYTEPQNNLSIIEPTIQTIANYAQYKNGFNFHWWDMKYQNGLVENALSSSSSSTATTTSTMMDRLEYEILDAYEVLTRRPDGHMWGNNKDCLHYCLPGPPDVLSRMLVHTLMRWKASQHLDYDWS